jgi:transcriptional regulator with XRE-family HTH domain
MEEVTMGVLDENDRSAADDRDRRERLGLSVDDLAAEADLNSAALVAYEQTRPGEQPDLVVGQKVREALDRLEARIAPDAT